MDDAIVGIENKLSAQFQTDQPQKYLRNVDFLNLAIWQEIKMSDGPSVYRIRILLDPLRRGAFTEYFKSLDVAIGNLPASSPYYLKASQWDSLAKHCTEWSNAPKGPEATLPEVEYLYRLISIHTLLNKHNRPKYDEPARELHNELMAQYQKTQTWLPLRDLIAGNLKGPRGFTFWTSYDLSIDVVRGACKVGLALNYLVSRSVILRCPVNHFRNACQQFLMGSTMPFS